MVESEDNKRGRIHRHGDGCELYSSDCTTISIQSAIARFSPGKLCSSARFVSIKKPAEGAGTRQQKSPLGFGLSLSLSLFLSLFLSLSRARMRKILSSLLSRILKSPRAPSTIYEQQFVSRIISAIFAVSFEGEKKKRRDKNQAMRD